LKRGKLGECSAGHTEVLRVTVGTYRMEAQNLSGRKRGTTARKRIVDDADAKRERGADDLTQKALWL
jgi:hypothetical protein